MEMNEYFDSFSEHDPGEFSKSQMKIIRRALKAEYLPEEMKFLDNPKYSLQQMNEVFDAMQEGQDVARIASESMSVEEMQRIREEMRNTDIPVAGSVPQDIPEPQAAKQREEMENMNNNMNNNNLSQAAPDRTVSAEDPDIAAAMQQMEAEAELQAGMEIDGDEMGTTVNEDVIYAMEDSINYNERVRQGMDEVNRETTKEAAKAAGGKLPDVDVEKMTDSGPGIGETLGEKQQEQAGPAGGSRLPAVELSFRDGITKGNAFELMESLRDGTDRVFYFELDGHTFYSDTFDRGNAIMELKSGVIPPERTDIVKGGLPKDVLSIRSTARDEAGAQELAGKIARYTSTEVVINHQGKHIFTEDHSRDAGIARANDLGREQMEKTYKEILMSNAPHERIEFFKTVADMFNEDPVNFKDNMFAMAAKDCKQCNMEILQSARELSNQLAIAAERGVDRKDIQELKHSSEEIKNMALRASREKKKLLTEYVESKGGVVKDPTGGIFVSKSAFQAIQNDLGGLTLARIADMQEKINCHMQNMEKNGQEMRDLVSKPELITRAAVSRVKTHFKQRECNSLTVEHSLDKLHKERVDEKIRKLQAKLEKEQSKLNSKTKQKQGKYNEKALLKQQKKNLFRYGQEQVTVQAKRAKQRTSLVQKILDAKIAKLSAQSRTLGAQMMQTQARITAIKTEIVQDALSQKIAREAKGMDTRSQDNIIRSNTKLADIAFGKNWEAEVNAKNNVKKPETDRGGKRKDGPDLNDAVKRAAERNREQNAKKTDKTKTKNAPKRDDGAR